MKNVGEIRVNKKINCDVLISSYYCKAIHHTTGVIAIPQLKTIMRLFNSLIFCAFLPQLVVS